MPNHCGAAQEAPPPRCKLRGRPKARQTHIKRHSPAAACMWGGSSRQPRPKRVADRTRYELPLVGMQHYGVDRRPALVLSLAAGGPQVPYFHCGSRGEGLWRRLVQGS